MCRLFFDCNKMDLRLRLLLQLILIFAANHVTAFPEIALVNKVVQSPESISPQIESSSNETSKLGDEPQGQFVPKLDDSNEKSTQTMKLVQVEESTIVSQADASIIAISKSNPKDESDSNRPIVKQFLWVSSQSTKPPEVPNRIQEVKPPQTPTNSPSISLEYKPNRPSFHPNPGNNVAQIVPPGKPWPASLEEYAGFSQTSTSKPPAWVQTQNKVIPELPSRIQEVAATTTKKPISLEYQPMRPSFHPNPDNPVQIVPPGKPWPASLEEYAGFSQTSTSKPPAWVQTQNKVIPELPSRIQEVAATTTKKPISLEYQPMRPSFHPSPDTVAQIVPPGKPWPATPEEYVGFSQTSPQLPNRIQEVTTSQDVVKPLIVAGYQPILPSYKPHPGNPSSQIIPPGKPWPADLAGYADFKPQSLKPQKLTQLPNQIQEVAPTDPKPGVPELSNRFQEISKEPTNKPSGPIYGPIWPYVDDYEELEYSSVNSLLLELLIGKSIADIGRNREKSMGEVATPVLYTSKVAKTRNVL